MSMIFDDENDSMIPPKLPKRIKKGHCPKCRVKLKRGIAMGETSTGIPDFIGGAVVTVSPGGPGFVQPCLKCPRCGYSITTE